MSFVSSGVAHEPQHLGQTIRRLTAEITGLRQAASQHERDRKEYEARIALQGAESGRRLTRIRQLEDDRRKLEERVRVKDLFLAQREELQTLTYLRTEYALKYLVENWPQVFADGVVARIADYVWGTGFRAWEEHDLELRIMAQSRVEYDQASGSLFYEGKSWFTGPKHFLKADGHAEDEEDESRIWLLERTSLRNIPLPDPPSP